jgi:4-hydroxyphenylpyruvate dioxygenase-like putative hemolysin
MLYNIKDSFTLLRPMTLYTSTVNIRMVLNVNEHDRSLTDEFVIHFKYFEVYI